MTNSDLQALHRKLTFEQHKPHNKQMVTSGSASLVTPVVQPATYQEKFEDTKGVSRNHKSKTETTHWPKEKGQKDKQRSTKHYTENKRSRNTNIPKSGGELRCSGRVSSS